jgi:membrane fusion protein, multidrug efflux system
MNKYKLWIGIVIVIIALIFIKLTFLKPKDDKGKATQGKPNSSTVGGYVVKYETLEQQIYVSGEVASFNKIIGLYISDGQQVSKGTLLAKINDADFQAQLQKNNSQVSLAQIKLERLKKLKAIEGASQEELDVIENEISTLKADQAYIVAQIAKTNISAPFSGTLSFKNVSNGAFVNTSDILATLVQTSPSYIDFSIPEKYSNTVRKGQSISFETDNIKTSKLNAVITAIDPEIDPNTKSLKCRATYMGSTTLTIGAFVKVFVNFGDVKGATMIPTECIVPTLKGQKIFIIKNGTAEELFVKTGVRNNEKIQIFEGLSEGDTLVRTGLLGLKAGTSVKVKQTN